MSLTLNKILRSSTNRRNSFFDNILPSSAIAFKQTSSTLINSQSTSDHILSSQILIPSDQLQQYLKIYQWRNQSVHAIVKCAWTGIYPADQKQMIIETKHKKFSFTLKNLNKVSLTQCLYILSSIVPSFSELFIKFGSFEFSQQNIFFDQNLNCEVWINQNPSLNLYEKSQKSQKQILIDIIKLMQAHELKSNIGKEFFSQIYLKKDLTFSNLQDYVFQFVSKKQLILKKNLIKQNFMKKTQSNISSIENIQIKNNFKSINQEKNCQFLNFSQKKTQRKRISKPLKESYSTAIHAQDRSQSSSSSYDQIQNYRSGQMILDKSKQKTQKQMIKSLYALQKDKDKKYINKNYYSHVNKKQSGNIQDVSENVQEISSQTHKQQHKTNLKLCPSTMQLQIDPQQQKIDKVAKTEMKQLFKIFDLNKKQKNNESFQNSYKIKIKQATSSGQSSQLNSKKCDQSFFQTDIKDDQFSYGMMRSTFSRIQQTNSRIQQNQEYIQINQKEKKNPILNQLIEHQNNNVQKCNFQNYENNCKIILPNIGNLFNLDNFYNKKEMSNSITMPDYLGLCRKRSQSPIKLQKLGKLKMQTAQSIISNNGFGYYDD